MQGIGLNGVALQSAMTNEGRNVNRATAKCHNGWEQDMSNYPGQPSVAAVYFYAGFAKAQRFGNFPRTKPVLWSTKPGVLQVSLRHLATRSSNVGQAKLVRNARASAIETQVTA